tara:strand:- start:234 stop:476 length:243 start_codon:yes stop_codon:yes gene_type:complete
MVTIPYYEVMEEVSENQINELARLGRHDLKAGYRHHNGNWYKRIGSAGATHECFLESRKRPLTLKEIEEWPQQVETPSDT